MSISFVPSLIPVESGVEPDIYIGERVKLDKTYINLYVETPEVRISVARRWFPVLREAAQRANGPRRLHVGDRDIDLSRAALTRLANLLEHTLC
jgi:hypothetical protein